MILDYKMGTIKVGITGQTELIGGCLYNYLGLEKDVERIVFSDGDFSNDKTLRSFVKRCDVIVHLAAMCRNEDQSLIYKFNMELVNQLIGAMEVERVKPHVIFESSTQEKLDNPYGRSKREGRELFEKWAERNKSRFTGLIIPNVYGPFGRPYYNSFISTFCYQLTHGEKPIINVDNDVKLLYVGSLCELIIDQIRSTKKEHIQCIDVHPDLEKKVSEVLGLLEGYKDLYFNKSLIPELKSKDEMNLFNTFQCSIDYKNRFPMKLIKHADDRGVFVETMKTGIGGQFSFFTTVPKVTRGNHYHTRKIERFIVIKGLARIQIRRIGSNETFEFYLDGKEPAFVDMPIWHTHNITNVGKDELYTQVWINEWYDEKDPDTFSEKI